MDLSIVIPAFNEEQLLPATLAAVRDVGVILTQAGMSWEVIVCDNNSTDRTALIARAAGVKVVFEPINQISRARNAGAAVAAGDWLLFVDGDSEPSRDLITELITTLRSGHFVAGGAVISGQGTPWLYARLVSVWNWVSRIRGQAAGSFFFTRREAFEAVGGFSTLLFAAEELDLSNRLKAWGRPRALRFTILHRYPLRTSARKIHLYSSWEFSVFMLRSLFSGMRNLRSRDECAIWYDGRR
jgi:glycosyltransferase involved in cell wall biosynthesis